MKKIILSATILLAITIVGCKSGGDPKDVLKNFFEALSKKDINEAKKYATKDSEQMLGFMQMGMSMQQGKDKENDFEKNNLQFGDAKIEGDRATVPVTNKKSGETTNYILKKESGSWKVAFDKATMTQMGTEKMNKMNGNNGMDMNNGMNGMDSATNMMNDMNRGNNGGPGPDDDSAR